MIRTLTFISLFSLLFSCGKNPYLDADNSGGGTLIINPLSPELDMRKNWDFGALIVGDKNFINVQVDNDGEADVKINSLSKVEEPYVLVGDTCTGNTLKSFESCLYRFYFSPLTKGIAETKVSVNVSSEVEDKTYTLNFRGNGLEFLGNHSEGGDELSLNYLANMNLDFGDIEIQSTYLKKIRFSNSTGKRAEIITYRISDSGNIKFASKSGDTLECSNIIEEDCFTSFSLEAIEEGSQVEYIYVDYRFEGEDSLRTLIIKVNYNAVKKGVQCYTYSESPYRVSEKEDYSDYVKGLDLPYYSSSSRTRLRLTTINNLETTHETIVNNKKYLYNKDSQVFFSFNVETFSGSLNSARMEMDLRKSIDQPGRNLDTELFCQLDAQICSGKYFTSTQNRSLINRDFSHCSEQFHKTVFDESILIDGVAKARYELKKSFNLADYLLLKASPLTRFADKNGSLSFAMADEISFISEPILILEHKDLKACK